MRRSVDFPQPDRHEDDEFVLVRLERLTPWMTDRAKRLTIVELEGTAQTASRRCRRASGDAGRSVFWKASLVVHFVAPIVSPRTTCRRPDREHRHREAPPPALERRWRRRWQL